MTNTSKFPMTELSAAVAPVRRRHAGLIEAASAWQAGRERPTDPDLFALICAGAEHAARFGAGDEANPTRWTRLGVYGMVRCDIPNWCSSRRCLWPPELPQAMWTWFDFLHATGRLHPASDPVAELRKPLACFGWLDQDGHPLPPDAPRDIPCECMLPYRETVELLDELVRQSERSGQDPLDRLRALVGQPTRSRWRDGWPFLDDDGPEQALDLDELLWSEPASDEPDEER